MFSGSERTLIERMLGKSPPFNKAGQVIRLQKLEADRFAEFLAREGGRYVVSDSLLREWVARRTF